jgi:hypothetical protein
MEVMLYLCEFAAGFVYLAVGARLYLLSKHTGRSPERLLAACFLLWGSNYFLYDIPYLVFDESTAMPFFFASRLTLDLGTFVFAVFTWKVFRGEARWAPWLVTATAALLLAGLGGSVWIGDWEGFQTIGNPWFWPGWLGQTVPFLWMSMEGIHHYRRARQRERLGLCDPLDCHRFLLWGGAGALWVVLQAIIIFQYADYEITQQWGGWVGIVVGLLEIVPVVMAGMVFNPPAFYREWISRSANA